MYKFKTPLNKTLYFNEDVSDDDKYIIFTCAKNEEEYIVEWIDHHLKIGFDKIIICDNNDDNSTLPKVIDKYIKDKTVEIYDVTNKGRIQVELFDMFAKQGHYKWCAFIDVDEFIEISGKYKDIKELLDKCPAECFGINWILFGTNGKKYKEKGNVQDRFTTPIIPISTLKENFFVKCILKKTNNKLIDYNRPHFPEGCNSYCYGNFTEITDKATMFNCSPDYKEAYIKHYYSKSEEEYIQKKERGWANCDDNILRQDSHLELLSINNNVNDAYYTELLFAINDDNNDVAKSIGKYDIYVIAGTNNFYYDIITAIGILFKRCKNITVIVDINTRNDIFNSLLEYAMKTGNRLIACENNHDKHVEIYKRFHNPDAGFKNTYYKLIIP